MLYHSSSGPVEDRFTTVAIWPNLNQTYPIPRAIVLAVHLINFLLFIALRTNDVTSFDR